MSKGSIGILSVGAGDTKLSFDPTNPAEVIRSSRIVRDMLRRGYALLVEVEPGKFQRALDFDEKTSSYIIADFDPMIAAKVDAEDHAEAEEVASAAPAPAAVESHEPVLEEGRKRGRAKGRSVPAAGTRGVAVSRSAGG